jgi:hypothetical protein
LYKQVIHVLAVSLVGVISVCAPARARPDIADAYLVDVEVNRGNSGAPVYLTENAAVIGVCVGSKPAPVRDQQGDNVRIGNRELLYSSGLTIIVPVRYVIELLRTHSLDWTEVTR